MSRYTSKPDTATVKKGIIGFEINDVLAYKTATTYGDPIPQALECVAELKRRGWSIVLITDQSNAVSVEQIEKRNELLLQQLGNAGCYSIEGIFYSLTKDKKDPFVKPNVGMFKRAEGILKRTLKGGYYIGSTVKDMKAAIRANMKPILIATSQELSKLENFSNRNIKAQVKVLQNLTEIFEVIT